MSIKPNSSRMLLPVPMMSRVASRSRSWRVSVASDRFAVTKEFLAQLMGANRPMVSVLVSALETAGILNVDGRWVTLADRDRLKEAACECYDIIRKNYEAVGR
jgi:hypothetical protein